MSNFTDITKPSFRKDEHTQTIYELWESIENFANNRMRSIDIEATYPLELRIAQTKVLSALTAALEETHEAMSKLSN